MKIETDLDKIQLLGKKKEEENYRFRIYLKNLDIKLEVLDKFVHSINNKVTAQIDCTQCANCCKTIKPELDGSDTKKISKGLNITVKELTKTYCVKSKDGEDKLSLVLYKSEWVTQKLSLF